jgi:hypothetical protein
MHVSLKRILCGGLFFAATGALAQSAPPVSEAPSQVAEAEPVPTAPLDLSGDALSPPASIDLPPVQSPSALPATPIKNAQAVDSLPAPDAEPNAEPNLDAPLNAGQEAPIPEEQSPVEPLKELQPEEPRIAERVESAPTPSSVAEIDPREPAYTRVRPTWGHQLNYGASGFGQDSKILGARRSFMRAFNLETEWQPESLQGAGIIGIGGALSMYAELPEREVARYPYDIWSVGLQARYQFRYFRQQPLVPYLAAGAHYLSYQVVRNGAGKIPITHFAPGVMVLLNWFEPSAAAAFYGNYGVTRSYLVAEYRVFKGADANITLDSSSLFFGLRIER